MLLVILKSLLKKGYADSGLAFVRALPDMISHKESYPNLMNELTAHINWFSNRESFAMANSQELDDHGTRLWNLSLKLKGYPNSSELVCLSMSFSNAVILHNLIFLVRVFASLLLDLICRAIPSNTQSLSSRSLLCTNLMPSDVIRTYKCALEASKLCLGLITMVGWDVRRTYSALDNDHVAFAEKLIENTAHYQQSLVNSGRVTESPEDHGILAGQYMLLRLTLVRCLLLRSMWNKI